MTGPSTEALLQRQARLQAEAADVLDDLDLIGVLEAAGAPHQVGSVAHGLMIWRDIDVTVVCDRLDVPSVMQIGSHLAGHQRVRSIQFRNDTGDWNTHSDAYPDGLYLGVEYVGEHRWELDLWFVDEPDRQPDLEHVAWIAERMTHEHRATILTIKHAWHRRAEYGETVSSYDVYAAVLDGGIGSLEGFDALIEQRRTR